MSPFWHNPVPTETEQTMSAVNKVILVGNLGAQPELRTLPSGSVVANLRLATSETRKNRAAGSTTEHTEWHRIVLFDRQAELASQYLHKGSQVYIEGKLRTRKFQSQDGSEKYITEVIADQMQFLGAHLEGRTHESGTYRTRNEKVPHPSDSFDDAEIPF